MSEREPRDDDAGTVARSLVDQTDHFAILAVNAIQGARADVAALSLVTAAFVALRREAEIFGSDDVEATVMQLLHHAIIGAREYSKALVADGTISFPAPRFYARSDAEKRAFGIDE